MFNLKSKSKVQTFKKTLQQVSDSKPQSRQEVTVKEIHDAFDQAAENLIAEVNSVEFPDVSISSELSLLGFRFTENVLRDNVLIDKISEAKLSEQNLKYYQTYYPNNKFITSKLVETICAKYGLVHGGVEYFIGSIPQKNAKEIINFKMRDEDGYQFPCFWKADSGVKIWGYNNWNRDNFVPLYDETIKSVFGGRKRLSICATEKDFDMTYLKKVGVNLQLKDPIVLQEVTGGYLIISKWGIEASDPLLTNEIDN